VYVADHDNNRVLKLAAGSSTQTVLPFTGLKRPAGVAVATDGTVYVTATGAEPNKVLKLPSGSSTPTDLARTLDSYQLGDVAVDTTGGVYVADTNHHQVVKLPPG
jgi:serine/threonine protein kinase, bacterial